MDRKIVAVTLYAIFALLVIVGAVRSSVAQTSGPAISLAPTTTAVRDPVTNNWKLITPEKAAGAPTGALAGAGVGNVDNGLHLYRVTFVTAEGQTNAATSSGSVTVVDKTLDGKVSLSSIPTGSVFVTARKVYRTVAGGSVFKLLTTISDNSTTTFTDNVADASLTTTAPTNNTTANPILSYTGSSGVVKVAGAALPTGTVTNVSGTANQISVATGTTTPVISLVTTPISTNFISGLASTATAAGTTTLTVASKRVQVFTGSATQTITLPVVTTLLQVGFSFDIQNDSTGALTVNSSGGNLVQTMAPGTRATFTCKLLTGTDAASWNVTYTGGGTPYDVAMSYSGVPDASSVIRIAIPRAFNSGASWAGSLCSANVAATAQADFVLAVNGVTKLTLRFAAAGTTCSLVSPTSVTFAAGDVITVTSPGTPDGTLSDVAISLKGSLP